MMKAANNSVNGSGQLSERLSAIANMDRLQLLAEWKLMHRKTAPKHLSRRFMERAFMYEAQCSALGGLSKGLQKRLKSLANGHMCSFSTNCEASVDGNSSSADYAGTISTMRSIPAETRPLPRPGTTLVREWNGRTYQVEATDEGYVMDGKPFRSLSAIALRITGTKWSGPRFFGLSEQPVKSQKPHSLQGA